MSVQKKFIQMLFRKADPPMHWKPLGNLPSQARLTKYEQSWTNQR